MPKAKTKASTNKAKKQAFLLSKREACSSLGITAVTFNKWKVPEHSRDGQRVYVTVADIVENRVEAALKKAGVADDPRTGKAFRGKTDENRARLLDAQATAQELKNKITKQEVLPIDFITYYLGHFAVRISAFIDTFPLNAARALGLKGRDVEKLKKLAVQLGNDIAALSDEERVEDLVDSYLKDND